MKVCYVTHFPNLTGANRSLLDILSGWKNSEVEPVVLLGKSGPLETELNRLGIRYKIIPYSTSVMEQGKPHINLAKKLKTYLAVPKIAKFMKEEKFDLVHSNSMLVRSGMEAAYRSKIPYICHLRDFIWEDHRMKLIDEDRQYELLKNANAIITISKAVENKFAPLVGKTPVKTVYDGIEISNYLIEDKDIFGKEGVNLLLAGRIAPGKGQIEAIKAVRELSRRGIKDVKLRIVGSVGDESYDRKIREYIDKHNISQVEMISFTNDMSELQRQCDIGLVCSSAEALGRVTVESMLSGCLTIGARAGATTELIKEGETGLLYESGNYKDLADKIVYALAHVEEMRKIAKNGQEYAVKHFDNREYNQKILEIYREVLEKC